MTITDEHFLGVFASAAAVAAAAVDAHKMHTI